jgi:signal transduction histidine kinase/ActR/RegA family two-component response regulator
MRSDNSEERVLLLAPTGRDAAMAETVLAQAGIVACVCADSSELCREIEGGAGAALLAEEALTGGGTKSLFRTLERQPPWSDLPILLFASSEASADRLLESFGSHANVTILDRPILITTVVSAVRAALRVRARQYQMRDLLRRLEEAGRQKDMFLAMLGHELRNPLNAISGAVQALDEVSSQAPRPQMLRAIIGRQTRHLSRLVEDLLDVSRITSGKIVLHEQPVDLNDVAERCLQALRLREDAPSHALTSSILGRPSTVYGDPARLEQVVSNLLNNAIKYTPEGGQIHLSVAHEGGEAVLRVKDNGVGIAPRMLPTVFDLFTQADETLDRSQGGLGLGLTLVKRLVEKHGGSVTAESAGLGGGSTFTVRLPLIPAAQQAAEAEPETSGARPRHVLIIEDSADGREPLRLLLELRGHRVDTAEDGRQGLEMALALRPDVAIVDIGLPLLTGYEVAERIRATPAGSRMFLVALTGYGQEEDRLRAKAAGFDAHLVKPLDFDEVGRLLQSRQPG